MTWSVPWNEHTQAEITKKVCEHFDPQAMFVQRLVKGGISIDELRAEWLEAHPLSERRPDLSLIEPGCPEALIELVTQCWADDADARPIFSECLEEIERIQASQTLPAVLNWSSNPEADLGTDDRVLGMGFVNWWNHLHGHFHTWGNNADSGHIFVHGHYLPPRAGTMLPGTLSVQVKDIKI